jgi:hypothetical protein
MTLKKLNLGQEYLGLFLHPAKPSAAFPNLVRLSLYQLKSKDCKYGNVSDIFLILVRMWHTGMFCGKKFFTLNFSENCTLFDISGRTFFPAAELFGKIGRRILPGVGNTEGTLLRKKIGIAKVTRAYIRHKLRASTPLKFFWPSL